MYQDSPRRYQRGSPSSDDYDAEQVGSYVRRPESREGGRFSDTYARETTFSDRELQRDLGPLFASHEEKTDLSQRIDEKADDDMEVTICNAMKDMANSQNVCFDTLYSGRCRKGAECRYSHDELAIKRCREQCGADFVRIFGRDVEEAIKAGRMEQLLQTLKGLVP